MIELVDIAELYLALSELPAPPCDGKLHGTGDQRHDDGPGTHYFVRNHECTKPSGVIFTRCERKSRELLTWLASPTQVKCQHCRQVMPTSEWLRYVGPIGKV